MHYTNIANIFFLFFGSLSTAIYLAAYIVDLTLILYRIFRVMVVNPPIILSLKFVMKAQAIHKSRSSLIHAQVEEGAFDFSLEEKIGRVIRDEMVHTNNFSMTLV